MGSMRTYLRIASTLLVRTPMISEGRAYLATRRMAVTGRWILDVKRRWSSEPARWPRP